MALGLIDSIPLAHDLLYPEQERRRTNLSRELEISQTQLAEEALHAPYQTAKERNPSLPDEDFALIDVDFCSTGHGQRDLPSITFLMRPSYTEIGLAPAERREEERRMAVAQSMAPLTQAPSVAGGMMSGSLPSGSLAGATQYGSQSGTGESGGLSQWNVAASRTFKHAKQLDVCHQKWIDDAAILKFGLLHVPGHNSSLTADDVKTITSRIFNLIAYVTSNGVALGTRKNDTNQTFYNTQQGKLVAATIWKYICSLASEAWGQWEGSKNRNTHHAPRILDLPANTIASRILDDAKVDELSLGSQAAKASLQSAVEEVIHSYTISLKKSVQGNKKAPCPLLHTREDFVNPAGLGEEVLPKTMSLVTADAAALAQRPPTDFEAEVEAPLFLASNVPLHATLEKIASASEFNQRNAASGKKLPNDAELLSLFKTQDLVKSNGAVPLAVMPVFPDGYTRIALDQAAAAYTHDFGNNHRGLSHVILNGERNTFVPGSYVPSDARTPNILFNDRLHFRPENTDGAVLGSKRTRRGLTSSASEGPSETTAYTTGTTQNKFEKYLADQSSTISYILKVVPPPPQNGAPTSTRGDESGDDNPTTIGGILGPVVTYSRIPTLTRFKRAQARITAGDVIKTVSVSWTADEDGAKEEQFDLVQDDAAEPTDNANTETASNK
eukprot:GILJ01021102.1.p1 GENE.GILJ01021102.1~~GILJ01021102.1.p1  ORF type:complete len:771 (-),score=148.85 GILJ01021102.1:60-2069(-)